MVYKLGLSRGMFLRYISHFTWYESLGGQKKFLLQGILNSILAFKWQKNETPTTFSPCLQSSDNIVNEYALWVEIFYCKIINFRGTFNFVYFVGEQNPRN